MLARAAVVAVMAIYSVHETSAGDLFYTDGHHVVWISAPTISECPNAVAGGWIGCASVGNSRDDQSGCRKSPVLQRSHACFIHRQGFAYGLTKPLAWNRHVVPRVVTQPCEELIGKLLCKILEVNFANGHSDQLVASSPKPTSV